MKPFWIKDSDREFPGLWRNRLNDRFVALELMSEDEQPFAEPECMCDLYRERMFKALGKFRLRSAFRFWYFGLIRLIELDRRETWDVLVVRHAARKPLPLKWLQLRVHRIAVGLSRPTKTWSRQSFQRRAEVVTSDAVTG